ncbi:MarR family winged helix-turn-helix transcriptional regulator [Oceanobacillus sp. Castelsardo]|uniref:MarR family winged helix-turn-helix transcriptional regulator n=1 Tax=Oceanobacillus sp. Castelsardo TaxID=1851204 RepID=UPI0008395FE9|nr:MarR family transcriptional regulator [Oceanobacillus sp. Castelsardo]
METEFNKLDLIDSLSERHHQLRRIIEELWNDNSNIQLSNSEWFIMARIYKRQPTIAHVSKSVDISRQATHKLIKKLEAKGLVEINDVEDNKKVKSIRLTTLGEECYEKNEQLKKTVQKKISDKIGTEKINMLKELLQMDWGLDNLD